MWHRAGQWAWVSDCSKYSVSASKIDDLRYGYSAWYVGTKPATALLTTIDAQEARAACLKHWQEAKSTTTEMQFGEQEVER